MSKKLPGKYIVNAYVLDKGGLGIDQNIRDSMHIYYKRISRIDVVADKPDGGKILVATVDEALKQARDRGFNYMIITWEGNTPKLSLYHEACVAHVEWLESKYGTNWLVSGHVMDQYQNRLFMRDITAAQWKDSFFLFPITAIVNIDKWKELGCPEWGNTGAAKSVIGVPSQEQVHDTYTPLVLMPPEDKTMKKIKVRPGWNIINQSLLNDMPVHNMSEDIRVGQIYMYPEDNIEKYNNFWRAVHLLPSLSGTLGRAWENIAIAKTPTRSVENSARYFLVNTEAYGPDDEFMTNLQTANSVTSEEMDYDSFKLFIGPASGWKGFILDATKMPNVTTHCHFDIYKECIAIKQKLLKLWDGKRSTYGPLLTAIGLEIYPGSVNGHRAYHMNENKNFDFSYVHLLKKIYPHVDPALAPDHILCKPWEIYRNKSHRFITGDMLSDPHHILAITRDHGLQRAYLWLSDIASWRTNVIAFGMHTLRSQLTEIIKILLNKRLQGVVDFRDTVSDAQLFKEFNDAIKFLELRTMEDVWTHLTKDLNGESSPELP